MQVAIYARKSTSQADVAEDARSVDRQVAGALAFIKSHQGWETADEHIYADDGVSGALFISRPEFQRMMRDAEAEAFGAVVFYDLDRFGRHTHSTMVALNTLINFGVEIWDYSTGSRIDLDSFEGEFMTFMRASFAQQYRQQVRKHTRDAMRRKAEQGHVTGGRVFGYDNDRIAKGHCERRINTAEAAIVRDIYRRFAAGEGARSIARALNRGAVQSPRAQQQRPSGWSASTIRAVLDRPLYRGEVVYGRSAKAYGRELGHKAAREKGQVKVSNDKWIRVARPELAIVDADLAARVDWRREDRRTRYLASRERGGRVPERAHGKYLLSGGMLICPVCGGHFEARKYPWKGNAGGVYICSTSRRKPGICTNPMALPIDQTDGEVLSVIDRDLLTPDFVEELLASVVDSSFEASRWKFELDGLRTEVDRLTDAIAAGVAAETLAPKIRQREVEIAKLERRLHAAMRGPLDRSRLRAALEQRTATWRADLRAETNIARIVVRELIGPIELHTPKPDWIVEWEANVRREPVLAGLVQDGSSPTGFEPVFWP